MEKSDSNNTNILQPHLPDGTISFDNNDHPNAISSDTREVNRVDNPPNPSTTASCSIGEPLCPTGHIMEKKRIVKGTCHICCRSLVAGKEILTCTPCQGFTACPYCINDYINHPEYIASVNYYSAGKTFFDQGNYPCAVEEFKKSLNLREVWTTKNPPLGFSVSALSAEILAKAQYLAGEVDTAIQSCALAVSYYETSGEDWIDDAALARQLSKEIKCRTWKEYRCPRGHVMQRYIEKFKGSTCDVCHSSVNIGDQDLVCHPCQGYAVCTNCKEKSNEPNPYTTSTEYYDLGKSFMDQGDYEKARKNFQKCLDIRESRWEKKWITSTSCAMSAKMLVRAQVFSGDTDAARETCAMAKSLYEAQVESWYYEMGTELFDKGNYVGAAEQLQRCLEIGEASKKCDFFDQLDGRCVQMLATAQRKAKLLQEGIENMQKQAGEIQPLRLQLPGVSVYHLLTTFTAQSKLSNVNHNPSIHEIENLQGPPGVIRRRSLTVVCPVDGKIGSAYVDTLSGEDHVGEATHILSYCWSYKIGDIVDSLSDYCKTHNLDPKRTYIWICCLCINQHRVVEQKESGGTGMLNFEEEFPRKLKTIGHMLAMMAPWQAPSYLTRLWCVFEMYVAHANGCKIDIVMPPKEKESLKRDVIGKGGGIDALYEALGNTNVQNADATVQSDKDVILGIIESTVGCQVLNNEVNQLLRGWMKQVLLQLVEKRNDATDERYATYCSSVGVILFKNGEHDAALEQYRKCLAIEEVVFGTNHPNTAATYNNIGLVLSRKGDYDGALGECRKCLAIQEAVLGSYHPETANTYNNIGLLLSKKGDYNGALEEYTKCLSIKLSVLDSGHPSVANTYNNIGSLLYKKADYDGALEQYQKSLDIREAVLGRGHPGTANAYNNIGLVLSRKGDYDGALEQYRKCLAIQEVVLGTNHPSTAITYKNIGVALGKKGDYEAALKECMKSLVVLENRFGRDHPETKKVLEWIDLWSG